jgi:nucleoside-diphosphate-sugar epimerase
VLVTGGNGFIGSHLAERLLDLGDSVTLLDLAFDSNTESLRVPKVQADVRDYAAVKEAVEGNDAVFHFAAVSRVAWGQEDPYNCWMTNAVGTLNVLEACRKARSRPTLFYASSREVYGEPQYVPVDEAHPKAPVSVYGMTKLSAERACRTYRAPSGIEGAVDQVIFRFSNVYGSERDLPERVIPKFLAQALRGEDITLFGGEQVLDFTFIDDTVAGILSAYLGAMDGSRDLLGEAFHFVTGRGVSIAELAAKIVDLTGSESQVRKGSANGFDVRRFVGSPEKSRQMLGYEPWVPLEEGLRILQERMLPTLCVT